MTYDYRKPKTKRHNRYAKKSNRRNTRLSLPRAPSNTHYFKSTFVTKHDIRDNGFQPIYSKSTLYNTFKLADLVNHTEYTALYDSYKICAIKQLFIYDQTASNSVVSGTVYEMPTLITVYDADNTTALASENEALEYKTFKARRLDKPIVRYFKPFQDNGIGGIYRVLHSGWNNSTAVTLEHHGIRVAVNTNNTGNTGILGALKVYTTFYLAMRNPL